MDWSSLVSTVLGGVLVLVSTLAVERTQWKHSRATDAEDRRRRAYADYLASLAEAGNNLRSLSRQETADQPERGARVHDAFAISGVHGHRYEVAILAPDPVVKVSDRVFVGLRQLRNLAEQGRLYPDPVYREALLRWQSDFAELRQLMRSDVGDVPR